MNKKYLSQYFGSADARSLDHYAKRSGYVQARRLLSGSMKSEQVVQAVKDSRLRGLGGAGFHTGDKWSFLPKESKKPRVLLVNADEGEAGTIKDRYLLTYEPHRLIEGILIACYAIQSHKCVVYLRGEYTEPYEHLKSAVEEAYAKSILGKNSMGTNYAVDILVHRGEGAYICGEETALIESLEGRKAFPRLRPPFPAVSGLYGAPTIIHNVETISYLPIIFEMGPEAFWKLGTTTSGGVHLVSVSGHIKNPGVYELPMGIPIRKIIYEVAGGIRGDRKLKAVLPGGISSSILRADEVDLAMDFDSLKSAGSMMGSSGLMVMDETTDIAHCLMVAARFFAHESCGQCSPCREGTGWMYRIIKNMLEKKGTVDDLDRLLSIASKIEGNTICAFGDAAVAPIKSYISKFRSEFEVFLNQNKKYA